MREDVIAGFTGTGFATVPPTIAGLQLLGIFGTNGDGKNSDRVAGGPVFSNLTNPPTFGTGWITVNNGTATATPTQGINSNFLESAGVVASGWTIFVVARTNIGSGNAIMMSIGPGQSSGLVLNPSNSIISNHPSVYLACQALAFTPNTDATIDLGAGTLLSNWRMYGVSYPAGAGARSYSVYDITGSVTKTTVTTHSRAAAGTNFVNFGNSSATNPGNSYQFADIAVGGFTTGVLSMPDMQTIRTWLLGVCASRNGATGF